MLVRFDRKKPRRFLLTFLYRISKVPFAGRRAKFKLFLNLAWIFERLAHERSFYFYKPEDHPVRKFSAKFILDSIEPHYAVVDLGCKYGEIANMVATRARYVVGVDFDPVAIQRAATLFKRDNLVFVNMELGQFLSKTTEQFDVLILSHVLEHLDDPAGLVGKFKSFFQYIYIEVPDFDKTYLNHYRKDFNADFLYSDNDHIFEFDREELNKLVEHCGLKVLKSEYRFGVQKLWCKV